MEGLQKHIREQASTTTSTGGTTIDSTKLRVYVCYYGGMNVYTGEIKGKFLSSFANASPITRSLAYEGLIPFEKL